MTLAEVQVALQGRTTELAGFSLGRAAFGVFAFNGTTKLTAPYGFHNSANPLASFLNTALTLKNASGAEVAYPNFQTGNPRPTDFRSPSLVAVNVPGESTTIGPSESFSTTFHLTVLRVDPLDVAQPSALLRVQSGPTRFITVAAAPLAVRGREIVMGDVPGHIEDPADFGGEWTLDSRKWTLEKAELTRDGSYRVTLERDL